MRVQGQPWRVWVGGSRVRDFIKVLDFWGGAPPPGGEAPSVVGLVMSVRPCIHPKP